MHEPVMVNEVIDLMAIKKGGYYVDGTVGNGGHALAILRKAGDAGRLVGIDRDREAVVRARETLPEVGYHAVLVHGNFSDLADLAQRAELDSVDGVLLDLGVSSDQIDTPERGFSFQSDGPLDMRMDRSQELTAANLVNDWEADDLADVLWRFGEERDSRRIAAAIVRARRSGEIRTTGQLSEVVSRAKGGRHGKTHPATQTFQALRMFVNSELENVEKGIESAIRLVKVGGRVAVISFHSIEDRLVKQIFNRHVGKMESLDAGGRRWVGEKPACKWVTKKPVEATEEEVRANPRARSAKLRVVERVN